MLFAGAGLTLLAPSAHAGTVTPTVHCVLPAGQGEGTGPQTMTVELSPIATTPGSTVHAVVTLGPGPTNSTQTLNDVPTTPKINLAMSGGATGSVTVTGATTNIDVVSGQPVQLPTFEGDFVIPSNANGVISFTPTGTTTITQVFGSNFTTNCDVTANSGVIATVTAQGPGSGQPTVVAPSGVLRPGNAVALSGSGFPANAATPTPSLCDSAGGNCNTSLFTANTLAVDANGVLSGTATLAAGGIPDGTYKLQVAAGGQIGQTTVVVETFVPVGNPVLSLNRTSGPVGTVVQVSGSNLPPNTLVRLNGVSATDTLESGSANYRSNGSGTLAPSNYTISTANTAAIRVTLVAVSGTPRYLLPFTVANEPPTLAVNEPVSHRNGTLALSGVNWPGGSAPTAALCDTAGNNCNAGSLTNSTLAIAADGTLSGTVKVGSSVAYGNYSVKVTAGTASATVPLTVQKHSISLSPSSGPLGTKTWITGDDFADWAWIKLYGVNAAGQKTGDYNYAAADGAGNWITWMYLNDPATVRIVAEETFNSSKKASAPFTYTP
ncbi:hypothetical protein [Yinghuangia sp. YIM S09857]|uniref:hypothetical protein n=1 Tax=Yinghuangia sp. YIM S09857 TaxID=3436929 RepID=UPI003F52A21E